jgi:DNA-binding NarL/FixJ family response regulator
VGNLIRIILTGHNEESSRILTILSNQDDFLIAGIEKDETGTIIKSERLQPNVLILDIQQQAMSGDELAPIIHRRSPSTAIILLSNIDDENYTYLALKAGISGYLLKEKDTDKLTSVIKIVSSGGYFISASIFVRAFNTAAFMNRFTGQAAELDYTFFSAAERSIVTEIAQGYSDAEIAKHLNFSIGTIKNYLTVIKRKTKLEKRIQIAIFSLVYGFIPLEKLDIWKNNGQFVNDTIQ